MQPLFATTSGRLFLGKCEDVLRAFKSDLKGKVQLILTSPPFPLNRKKRYGNLTGKAYVEWLSALAPAFAELLTADGSVVLELGNAWEPGQPIQSLLPIKSLLAFVENEKAGLKLCQEFVCLKPAADNTRVLREYSRSMKELLARQSYNSGKRPSQHNISKEGFLTRHRGAIPPNVITEDPELIPSDLLIGANTRSIEAYQDFCRHFDLGLHPARMPQFLAEFFIKFFSEAGDLVLDPFSGSNTVGWIAEQLNRRWISVEALEEFAIASVARFDGDVAESLLKKAAAA